MELDELQVGMVVEATFYPNTVAGSSFRYRATHLNGKRAPKVVLCDDARIRVGVPCMVRITAIRKPHRDDRGAIEVEFVQSQQIQLEGVWIDPVISKQLQVLLESGLNILLDGPQGCGKTTLARELAKQLGMEFVFFNCGAVVEATDFLATIQVRASASGSPVTDFVKTQILCALEEAHNTPHRKYLVFLDELNRCQESARNALMPALDSTRRIYHPIENRFLDIPDNVQFIAAVNRGSEFSGTFGIDAAQLDRFAPLQMGYPPAAEEERILQRRHKDLSAKIIRLIVTVADRLRKSPDLSGGLSLRATDEVCTYLKHPIIAQERKSLLPEVFKSAFCGRYPGKWSDTNSEAGIAWAAIQDELRSTGMLETDSEASSHD